MLSEALSAFEAAGYAERQAVVTHNLGILYLQLGLFRRARRLLRTAADGYARTAGAGIGGATSAWMLSYTEQALGNLTAAAEQIDKCVRIWQAAAIDRSRTRDIL